MRSTQIIHATAVAAVTLSGLVHSSPSHEAVQGTPDICCGRMLAAGLTVHYLESPEYAARESSYFYANFQLGPWCIVQPATTFEVAEAIKALTTSATKCTFAVRSGGKGTGNNVAEGITIDLGKMNSVVHHSGNQTVSVQAGASWGDVFPVTDKINITVAGGRNGHVGVGGLLLGGGIPFSMARTGLACDNVRQMEVVLANGDIVQASRDTNGDLFAALKGGSGNFGIVTKFDLDAVNMEKLWAGVVFYPNSEEITTALTDALVEFAGSIDTKGVDDASSLICQHHSAGAEDLFWFGQYANIDGIEWGESQSGFWAIQNRSVLSTLRYTNYSSLVGDLHLDVGMQVIWFTLTFKNDARVMTKAVELHNKLVAEVKEEFGTNFESMNMFQPLPAKAGGLAKEKGGNVLGLDRMVDTHILWLASLHIKDPEYAAQAQAKVAGWVSEVEQYATDHGVLGDFLFLNYANYIAQDPLSSYGAENIAKMVRVAKQYDPEGVFQYLSPSGFKISKSSVGYSEMTASSEIEHSEL